MVRQSGIFIGLVVVSLFMVTMAGAQQTGGQFCVQAFEDRNGNQKLDAGEPALTDGVTAQLMDAKGAIIDTALLKDSPTRASGMVCFPSKLQDLPAGQYSILVTSADYRATTPSTMTATVQGVGSRALLPYGAQRLTGAAASNPNVIPPPGQTTPALMERVLVAAFAAVGVILTMVVLGVLIYFLAFRSRLKRAIPDRSTNPRATTGSHPAVRVHDSGEFPKF